MDRRRFLKVGIAGLAGASVLSSVNVGTVLSRPAPRLDAEFEEAAREIRVPKRLLLAMGYVNTRWEMPPPDANVYEKGDLHGWGAYGIMQLVQNPWTNTLGEASRLTGISEEELKTDRRSNILGGAALLAESQGRRSKPPTIGEWFGAVDGRGGRGKEYRAVAGVGGGELYAEQVFDRLAIGARETNRAGELLTLLPTPRSARLADGWEVVR